MYELILAFFAGILKILAPCVLPILPIILGNSASTKSFHKPLTIILLLAFSIFLISILLILACNLINFRTEVLTKIY
jgi:cytochrome c biogenesis protein CcdA